MKRTADSPSPVLTVEGESIDETLRRIETAVGSTVRPRTEIQAMGAFANFKDTDGNVLGLWKSFQPQGERTGALDRAVAGPEEPVPEEPVPEEPVPEEPVPDSDGTLPGPQPARVRRSS